MVNDNPRRLLPGAIVEVRPWLEIASTFDEKRMLEALPFMPEMLRFCGGRFTVSKRVERTCERRKGQKANSKFVFLGRSHLDGRVHGGCQKACMIFWKTALLREVPHDIAILPAAHDEKQPNYPALQGIHDGHYSCQSTELFHATTTMFPFDLGSYFRDVLAETYSLREMGRMVGYASYLRLRSVLTGKSYRVIRGEGNTTPVEALNLQPGELVQVKSNKKSQPLWIRAGRNQGLAFRWDDAIVGKVFTVLNRVEKLSRVRPADRPVKKHGVLEGVLCDGCH